MATSKGSGAPERDGREARLAEALRANLHRRKAQSRARQAAEPTPAEQPEPPDQPEER